MKISWEMFSNMKKICVKRINQSLRFIILVCSPRSFVSELIFKWWPRYVFSNKDCSSIVYEMIEDRCKGKCLEGNLHIMICFRRLKIKAWRLPPTCVNLMKALLEGIIVVCLWHGIILCKMVGCWGGGAGSALTRAKKQF